MIAALESALAGALVFLAFGLFTRTATILVLGVGFALEAFQNSFGQVEHASVFLVFYVPLFMSASRWGDTWSLDARLREAPAGPDHDGTLYAWPFRALQVMLAALFVSAAAAKIVTGDWLLHGQAMEALLLAKNVEMLRQGLPVSNLLTYVVAHPPLAAGLQFALVAFEAAGILLLARPPVREVYAASALVFHALNALVRTSGRRLSGWRTAREAMRRRQAHRATAITSVVHSAAPLEKATMIP